MRILFMGTSPFAVPTLTALHQSPEHEIVGIVTQPDRPHGRGGRVTFSPVKEAMLPWGLPLFQPEKVRAKECVERVRELAPDALVVAAYGQIIPQRLLDIPRFGSINVHGSLLPRWRGAAPMQYALMAGDAETGVTTMQMNAGLDTGDILLQAALPLGQNETLGTLEPKLAALGAKLLLETLARMERGDCPLIPQDDAQATYAPSLPPEFGALEWARPARDLHNLIRGIAPKPGAYTFWQGKRLKILRAAAVESLEGEPGVVQTSDIRGITVVTGKGALQLLEVQPESKGVMPADAWARGARVAQGQRFDAAPPEACERGYIHARPD